MGVSNIFQTGRSGMVAAQAGIATAGHNISNANTEGYSRQRVQTAANTPKTTFLNHNQIGQGTQISRIERINDEYVENQIRNGARDLASMEEKDLALRQTEDIFNEMNGEGLNRLISRFFNEFRKLSNEPNNDAVRQSVREASQAMSNDFRRLRHEVEAVRKHIDSRLDGYSREVNSLTEEIRDLNMRIKQVELAGPSASANDLRDKRDNALKKLGTYMDLSTHLDDNGGYVVEARGVGPLVVGPQAEKFSVFRSQADPETGKPENAYDVATSGSASEQVTHAIRGGKLGALIEVRDQTLSAVLDRLDDLAFNITKEVNQIHEQGFTREGVQGVAFFRGLGGKERASEYISLSDAVLSNINNIATAAEPDAPGDNRIAIAISGLQNHRVMSDGKATMDDFYNSIVSEIGVTTNRNRSGMTQQKDIMTQLNKIRDQISGVSIDEETANLMQFQQIYGASAKVFQVADELLKTVLDLKR